MQLNFAFYIAIALTLAALVVWFMARRAPATTPSTTLVAYNLAPLVAAWLVALLVPASDHTFYKGAIVFGLLLATLGIALRESGLLPGYVAHAHLLLTYTLYAYAFASQTSGWPTPFALLLVAAAALLFWWLWPWLRELQSSLAVYGALLFLATWQALELAVQHPLWMGWAALAGMVLVVIAALLEVQGSFNPPRSPFKAQWSSAALPIFLLAQLAIAWSIWG